MLVVKTLNDTDIENIRCKWWGQKRLLNRELWNELGFPGLVGVRNGHVQTEKQRAENGETPAT